MNIQSLRYVITLAEELHFGRAAGRHYIVPQAFGRQVQRLDTSSASPTWLEVARDDRRFGVLIQ